LISLGKCLMIPQIFTSKTTTMNGCENLQEKTSYKTQLVVGQDMTWIIEHHGSGSHNTRLASSSIT